MSVTIDLRGLDRMLSRTETEHRQEEYALYCAFRIRKYVPMVTGMLRNSEPMSSDYKRGLLTWTPPYAARHYYEPMEHSTSGTCDHWDEECARQDGAALRAYAESLYGRY